MRHDARREAWSLDPAERTMRHPLDFSLAAVTLWLLASMIIDALTPKWLTVYMIGAALAPMMLIGIILHILDWRNKRPGSRKKADG
jgi:hypothetical protein